MPVNTAVTLLPPTPSRLQFANSSSDGGPDSPSSFQNTLQLASSSQDNSSTQDTLVPAKKVDTSKSTASGDARGAHKAKSKKAKHGAEDAIDETSAGHDDDGSTPVEAARDATDESEDKHPGAKTKDKAVTSGTAADVSALVGAPITPATARQTQPEGAGAEAATGDAVPASRVAKGQASAAATVRKTAADKDDKVDTDADSADETDTDTDAEEAAAKPAVSNFGVATGENGKAAKKGAGGTDAEDKPSAAAATTAAAAAVDSTAAVSSLLAPETDADDVKGSPSVSALDPSAAAVTVAGARTLATAKATGAAAVDPADKALATSDTQFAEMNHPQIVTAVHGQLLPDGGNMQIRLDPAELGTLQINVQVKNGAMTATFETSNADATRQLSHSLSDLRTVLEQAGVTVDKIHVQQSAKPDSHGSSGEDGNSKQGQSEQNPQAKQEQQRRELLQRMWKKLSGGDPLDLTA